MKHPKKVYAVVLHDGALNDLGELLKVWIRGGDNESHYLYCKAVDPNGPFVHMVLETPPIPGTNRPAIDMEFQIPHAYIKAIFCAADRDAFGFIDRP